MRRHWHALTFFLLALSCTTILADEPALSGDALPDRALARLGVVRPCWKSVTAHGFLTPTGTAFWPEYPNRAHAGAVYRVVFSPNGRWLVSVGREGARLWDVRGQTIRASVPVPANSFAAFTTDSRSALLVHDSAWVQLDTDTGRVIRRQSLQDTANFAPCAVAGIAVAYDGKQMTVLLDNHGSELRLQNWDLAAGIIQSTKTISSPRKGVVPAPSPNPDRREPPLPEEWGPRAIINNTRAVFTPDGRVYDARTGAYILTVAFLPDELPHRWKGPMKAARSSAVAVCASEEDPDAPNLNQFGRRLPVAPTVPTFCLVDAQAGRVLRRLWSGLHDRFELSSNGRWLAVLEQGGFGIWETMGGRYVLSFAQAGVSSLAFAPDNRSIATGLTNGTVLVWDLSPSKVPARETLAAGELAEAWACLAGTNGDAMYRAIWQLAAAKADAIALLAAKLKPFPLVSDEHLRDLIVDLSASSFARREAASRELSELGERATPVLSAAQNSTLTSEAQWRVSRLMRDRVVPPSLDTVRFLRGVEVLERIGTREAREVLVKLSEGDPGMLETRAAREALERLKSRE
jgi:WD40 repeat protein